MTGMARCQPERAAVKQIVPGKSAKQRTCGDSDPEVRKRLIGQAKKYRPGHGTGSIEGRSNERLE
ncbi:hypothetical protein KAM426_26480 [Aquipseudomonas alcaligenes]|uniref:Uncharacterized protein n=1 Tax=Aquipseudomonas alcaligenes TaxID=43263 RepID=A0ABD0AWU9_AQUAC|nr:hypothetical protein KAM426_26480 [Pseudomonas alcaligenes]GIZ76091.1 hypothetical protein KAM430_25000 [Pseudomonas alcaligenes]GIZ79809.1 hypothetical protein KAM432_18570 [Pseudomonas alcaligenes]GIZ84449.1 hypothetical protein KAM434_21440 [Pseudomonas alcaligenes]GIZ93512.1 hypothetical protein KAM436_24800 [Pseudomonas alcaligenes]